MAFRKGSQEFVEKQRGWIEERLGQAPKMMSVSEWLLQIGVVSMNGKVFGAVVERSEEIRRSGYTFSKIRMSLFFSFQETRVVKLNLKRSCGPKGYTSGALALSCPSPRA